MWRVRYAALAALITAVVLLSSCDRGSSPNLPADTISAPKYVWGSVSGRTLTVWGNKDDITRPYLAEAFRRYEETTGNRIVVTKFTKKEMEESVPDAFRNKNSAKPDLLLSFGGTNLDGMDPVNNFYDFTDAIWVDDLTDTAINQTIYERRVIGLPFWEASISGILYNKDIFRKLDIESPKNGKEFTDACARLLGSGVIPIYLPYAETSMLLYQFPMDSLLQDEKALAALNGGTISYSAIPGMKTMVEWYRNMSDKGYFGYDYENNGWDGMNEAMKSGKYAMMICWDTWLYTNFDGDPSQFGIMPAFMGVPDTGSFEGPNLAMLLVNKNSPELETALDLINFMADPYNYNVIFKDMYTAPVFKNQTGSVSTPQYAEKERLIDLLFYDSTAWLRVKGFAQEDASYIKKHMTDASYSAEDCLRDMDKARIKRISAMN